jgi:hypothetical protein
MVGTIKRWLGIKALENENLRLAKAYLAIGKRLATVEEDQRQNLAALAELEKRLTAEAEKPKIIAKPSAPKRVNWRQAREALEKANDAPEGE